MIHLTLSFVTMCALAATSFTMEPDRIVRMFVVEEEEKLVRKYLYEIVKPTIVKLQENMRNGGTDENHLNTHFQTFINQFSGNNRMTYEKHIFKEAVKQLATKTADITKYALASWHVQSDPEFSKENDVQTVVSKLNDLPDVPKNTVVSKSNDLQKIIRNFTGWNETLEEYRMQFTATDLERKHLVEEFDKGMLMFLADFYAVWCIQKKRKNLDIQFEERKNEVEFNFNDNKIYKLQAVLNTVSENKQEQFLKIVEDRLTIRLKQTFNCLKTVKVKKYINSPSKALILTYNNGKDSKLINI